MKNVKTFIMFALITILMVTTIACSNPKMAMPAQRYVGTWYTEDEDEGSASLQIKQINDETIVLEVAIYRSLAFSATAKIENNEIKFVGDDASAKVNGTMKFNDDEILLTIDETDFYDSTIVGKTFSFVVK